MDTSKETIENGSILSLLIWKKYGNGGTGRG